MRLRLLPILVLACVAGTLRAQEAPPIRLGVLHSQTGTMAISESPLIDAVRLAVDEVNRAGGVRGRPLQLLIVDTRSDPRVAAAEAERLITEEGVVSLFGCWTSACRKEVLPVLQRHRALLWYPVQYEGRESSGNIIYTGAAPNQQISPAIAWAVPRFGRRIFLVGSDYVFPRLANLGIREQVSRLGGTVVGEVYLPLGTTDVQPAVSRIAAARPDLVVNTINGGTNVYFFTELGRATAPQRIPTLSFSIAEAEIRTIGTHHLQGSYVAWNYFQSLPSPANRAFVDAFRRSAGPDAVTSDPIEAAYLQVLAFAEAAANAPRLEPMAIRDAALGLTMDSPGGLVRIDARTQHAWKVVRIGEIMPDGQIREAVESVVPVAPAPFGAPGAVRPMHGPGAPLADARAASPDDTVRLGEAALRVRGAVEADGETRGLLVRAARSPSFVLRYEAFAAAARLPALGPAVAEALAASREPFDQVLALRLLAAETTVRPVLAGDAVRRLASPHRAVRLQAGAALRAQAAAGWRADGGATSALIAALRDPELGARRNAVALLGASSDLAGRVLPVLTEEDFAAIDTFYRAPVCEAAAEVAVGAADAVRSGEEVRVLRRVVARLDGAACLSPARVQALRAAVDRARAAEGGGLAGAAARLFGAHAVLGPIAALVLLVVLAELLGLGVALAVAAVSPGALVDLLRGAAWLDDDSHRIRLRVVDVSPRRLFSPAWVAGSRPALRGWVIRHLDAYRRAFEQKPTVEARRRHVLLPVLFDGAGAPGEPSPAALGARLSGDRLRLHVAGEGGTGKTSLACQVARWCMSPDPAERLGRPGRGVREPLLAVFLEPGVPLEPGPEGVLRAIQREMTVDSRPVPLWLVRSLVAAGYVAAVLDDVSEIEGLHPAVLGTPELRSLGMIATGRAELGPEAGSWRVLRSVKLRGNLLAEFFLAYAKLSGRADALGGDLVRLVTEFRRILGPGEARQETVVFFARLFLDHTFAAADDGDGDAATRRPQSVPELVESFVDAICRHAAQRFGLARDEVTGLVRGTAHRAAEERCQAGTFALARVAADELRARPGDGASGDAVHVLVRTGLVDRPAPGALRFKVDLIQEYCAVLHVRDRAATAPSRADAHAHWRGWVDRIVGALGADAAESGLLRATLDVLRSDRVASEVPRDLVRQVAGILGETESGLQPVRIGILHSLQGTMAMSETPLRDAALLAVAEVNARGGIGGRPVEALVRDGASDPEVFAAEAARLIRDEGVVSLFGCWTSAARRAVRPVVEAEQSLLWYPVQYEGYEGSEAIVYTGAAPNQQILPALDWTLGTLLPERGVDPARARIYLVGSDYVFPRRTHAIVRRRLADAGLVPVGERYVRLGAHEFEAVADDIEAAKPDVVINTVNGSSNISFFQALAARGLDAAALPVVSLSLAEGEVRDIGVSRMRGHYAVWNYFQSLSLPANRRFVKAFQDEYGLGRVTSDPIATAYIQVHLFAAAMRLARGGGRGELLDRLAEVDLYTPAGRIVFDRATQHFAKHVFVGRIDEDGQFVVVNDGGESSRPVAPDPFPYPELAGAFEGEDGTAG